jgi:hypothetical protein
MELSNLLSAMVQGAETDTLAQIQSRGQAGSNAVAQTVVTASGQPGANLSGPAALALAGQPPSLNVTGQANGQPVVTLAGQPSLNLAGQAGLPAGQAAGAGQPGLTVAGQPGGLNINGSTATPVFNLAGQGITGQAGTALQPGATLTPPGQLNLPALMPRTGPAGVGPDVYYGSAAPASPSLLSQSGVGAYIQLLNAFASHEVSDKSANLVTNNLGAASATLKSSFYEAMSSLPTQLQQKDWGFSVSNGALVFTQGKDALSTQDLADLQKAFSGANVEFSAREVAAAITSIAQRRQEGADTGSLAWGGVNADDSNFGDVVNLRTYVTTSAPGSNYHPNTPAPAVPPQIPILLGGMDLRDLVSARPNFFHADGSVVTETEEEEEEAPLTVEDLGPLQGQCACGQVRFTVENTFEYAFFCHCSRCRVRTGSAFAAIAGVGIDKVQVTAGNDDLSIEGDCADGYGARCNRCHAFLFAAVRERQYMHVSLGVLEGIPNRLPDHHIYVGSKAPWFEITDNLPQHDELPDDEAKS